jgi:hypothetical protein
MKREPCEVCDKIAPLTDRGWCFQCVEEFNAWLSITPHVCERCPTPLSCRTVRRCLLKPVKPELVSKVG